MPLPQETETEGLPPTCSIKGLLAFSPGYHKGELYSAERSARVPANFKALPGTVPTNKVGHDKQQRFAQSLGFSNVGHISRCDPVPGYHGCWDVDIDNIPTEVGQQWNANWLKGSSVELGKQRHPDDATKELEPVLTGISLLGEEQPALRGFPAELRHRCHPKATFADGREVPPAKSAARWLNAMADVTRQMAAESGGEFSEERRTLRIGSREYTDTTVCFSDFTLLTRPAMNPDELRAKLVAAGIDAALIDKMIAAVGAAETPPAPMAAGAAPMAPAGATAAMAAPPPPVPPVPGAVMAEDPMAQMSAFAANMKKFADDPAATDKDKAFSAFADAMCKKMSEDSKRTKEMSAAVEAQQKEKEGAAMSAFSEYVDTLLNGEWNGTEAKNLHLAKKVPPAIRANLKARWLALYGPAAKTFANDSDRLKSFAAEVKTFADSPDVPGFTPAASVVPKSGPCNRTMTPLQLHMTRKGGILDRESPNATKKLREPAKA